MKVRTFVLSILIVSSFLSVGTKSTGLTEGYRQGNLAPRIEFLENDSDVLFSNYSGHYTLVNFWAAYDASSRARNVLLWNKIKELESDYVTLHSISMDEKSSVFEETLKADNLSRSNQWKASEEKASELRKKYGLKHGFKNYLIDDKGVIVKVNITPKQLHELVNSRG